MVSLLNGFSQAGTAIAGFAQSAGLEQQKSDLEKQQTILASQLQEGVQTRLIPLEGEQARETAVTSAGAQGDAAIKTATAENALPMSQFQQAQTDASQTSANAAMLEAKKPVSGGFTGTFLVPDKASPNGWKAITATSGTDIPTTRDPSSNNLSAQTGLSQAAIAVMSGQTKGMRMGQAQSKAVQDEITRWGIANGINTSTILPQVEGAFKTITQNVTRNNQGQILENEISGSVDTASTLADKVDLSKVNMANVAAIWAGKQVNDKDAIQVADQLGRLREELAGYNAVASGHLNDNGAPAIGPNDIHAAEATITNGINSGGLKALSESVKMSADKNKVILQQAIDDSNTNFYKLFGATYHTQPQDGGGAPPTATKAPPAISSIPKFTSPDDPAFKSLPSGSQFMGPDGTIRVK